ncbi:MAG TPA: hypothetical protein VJL87_07680 [Bdellovibrionota bacterium]|nr:hypothetical protein [Bdellovibrionota bacterium]
MKRSFLIFLTIIPSLAFGSEITGKAELALEFMESALLQLNGDTQNFAQALAYATEAKDLIDQQLQEEQNQELKAHLRKANLHLLLGLNYIKQEVANQASDQINEAANNTMDYLVAKNASGYCCTRSGCKGCLVGQTTLKNCRETTPTAKSFKYTDGTCVNF